MKWLRSPWVISSIVVLFVGLIVAGYWLQWGWTGFPTKTLWDWFNLLGVLAIPVVVGLGVAWYTAQQGKVSDRENTDNQREAALQAYIDKMSELLLEKGLRQSAEDDEVRVIARVRTMTILPRLDATRKSSVLLFLHESGLIKKEKHIIDLRGANLSRANLQTDNLEDANLSRADLSGADLSYADLSGADLSHAKLRSANLEGAYLDNVDLRGAELNDADMNGIILVGAENMTKEQCNSAKSLRGATMPDGSIHL